MKPLNKAAQEVLCKACGWTPEELQAIRAEWDRLMRKHGAAPLAPPTKRPRLAVGEVWHVELPGAEGALDTLTVVELTDKTVLLGAGEWRGRYELRAVRFVERKPAVVTPVTNKVVWAGTSAKSGVCSCLTADWRACMLHGLGGVR
jgi:hypothetical protein